MMATSRSEREELVVVTLARPMLVLSLTAPSALRSLFGAMAGHEMSDNGEE